jgi:hypothetical protein
MSTNLVVLSGVLPEAAAMLSALFLVLAMGNIRMDFLDRPNLQFGTLLKTEIFLLRCFRNLSYEWKSDDF